MKYGGKKGSSVQIKMERGDKGVKGVRRVVVIYREKRGVAKNVNSNF